MNTALGVLGALGGFAAFAALLVAVVRSISGQVNATKDNTAALQQLSGKLDKLDGKVDQQGERIARLEGRNPH